MSHLLMLQVNFMRKFFLRTFLNIHFVFFVNMWPFSTNMGKKEKRFAVKTFEPRFSMFVWPTERERVGENK